MTDNSEKSAVLEFSKLDEKTTVIDKYPTCSDIVER
jgi:hypothetical protein